MNQFTNIIQIELRDNTARFNWIGCRIVNACLYKKYNSGVMVVTVYDPQFLPNAATCK